MKKNLLSLSFILLCSFAVAQNANNTDSGSKSLFQPFEFAVNAGFTMSGISYPQSHIATGYKNGWTAGLTAQYNQEIWGYRIGVSYEMNKTHFLDESNPLKNTLSYNQSSIDIPVTLLLQSNNHKPFCLYTGAGVKMRYAFSSSLENLNYKTNNIQWNSHVVWGFRYSKFFIEQEISSQFNELFKSSGAPKAKFTNTSLKIGWIF